MPPPLPAKPDPSPDQAVREGRAWAGIKGVWRQLHGSYADHGLSVEWHDFRLDKDMDWGRSFHPGSLEICLNFAGAGALQDGDAEQELAANQVAVYTLQSRRLRAVRRASSLHRFLTLEIAPAFLRAQFGGELDSLKAPIRRFVESGAQAPPFLENLSHAGLVARGAAPVPAAAGVQGRPADLVSGADAGDPGAKPCSSGRRTGSCSASGTSG